MSEFKPGGTIKADEFPVALRGDDAVEFLPPVDMDHATKLMEILGELIDQQIGRDFQKLSEAMGEFAKAYNGSVKALPLKKALQRKKIRWDEDNRRRRLKGIPEKPNPYAGIINLQMTIWPNVPVESVVVEIDRSDLHGEVKKDV